MPADRGTLRRAAWLFLAVLLFVLFMVAGAMSASALFVDSAPTPDVVVTHGVVFIVSGAIAALCLMLAGRCAWRALE